MGANNNVMRLWLNYFVAFTKARTQTLRLTFLFGAFTYVAYIGAWYMWRGSVSNIPGFLFLLGSMPWSMPWLSLEWQTIGSIPWPIRNSITTLVISLGFGLNLALVTAAVWFLWSPTHNISVKRDAPQAARPLP